MPPKHSLFEAGAFASVWNVFLDIRWRKMRYLRTIKAKLVADKENTPITRNLVSLRNLETDSSAVLRAER
jgi:hypothetical protein